MCSLRRAEFAISVYKENGEFGELIAVAGMVMRVFCPSMGAPRQVAPRGGQAQNAQIPAIKFGLCVFRSLASAMQQLSHSLHRDFRHLL